MDRKFFKGMWESMQRRGYFANHPHYTDHFGAVLSEEDKDLDAMILSLDFSSDEVTMPIPYSEALERGVKRTESIWLYKMFDLPLGGTALDLGCGFGRSVQWLSKKYDHVFASDLSAEVIATAKQRCKAGNITFCVNTADALPQEIQGNAVDVAYIFTVFQHIPREFSLNLLTQLGSILNHRGVVAFNLLSNVNEDINKGETATEWAIGYSKQQARELVEAAGLKLIRLVNWSRPETKMSWLWVLAGR